MKMSQGEAEALNFFIGSILGIAVGAGIIALIVLILIIVTYWRIFKKAGKPGWASLVPLYNWIVLYKVAGISPLWLLVYLVAGVPVIGPLAVICVTAYCRVSLAKAFGKSDAFAIGLVLLHPIFMMILAFGDSEYQLGKKQPIEVNNNGNYNNNYNNNYNGNSNYSNGNYNNNYNGNNNYNNGNYNNNYNGNNNNNNNYNNSNYNGNNNYDINNNYNTNNGNNNNDNNNPIK